MWAVHDANRQRVEPEMLVHRIIEDLQRNHGIWTKAKVVNSELSKALSAEKAFPSNKDKILLLCAEQQSFRP